MSSVLGRIQQLLLQRWLDASIRKKGIAVIALPLITLLIASLSLLAVDLASTSESNNVQNSLQARSSLERVLVLTIDAETGIRGYILSGDTSYLAPYNQATKDLPGTFSSLSALLSNDPHSLKEVSQLKSEVQTDLSLLSQLRQITAHQTLGTTGTTLLRAEKHATDTIRQEVSALQSRVNAMVAKSESSNQRTDETGLIAVALALLFSIAGGIAATELFATGIASRIRMVRSNADRLAHGKPLFSVPNASDEVGALSDALNDAAGLLASHDSALREERSFLEHLVSATPVVKFQGTSAYPDNGFVSSNLGRVFGIEVEDISRQADGWLTWVHPEDRDLLVAEAEAALTDRRPELKSVYRIISKDGAQHWVSSSTRLEYSNTGQVTSLGVLVDATESHEAMQALTEREEMLSALFDTSPDAILVVNATGEITLASRALEQMTQRQLNGSSTLSLFDILDEDDAFSVRHQLLETSSGNRAAFSFRMRLLSVSGTNTVVEARGVALNEGRSDSPLVLVLRDISEQEALEKELLRASEAARTASAAKSDFLSRMSHELRTPLNAVLGFAQLLGLDELTEEQDEAVRQIRKGGQHLLGLINEVLEISRIEAGRLTLSPEPVEVSELCNEAVRLLSPLAIEHNIGLNVEITPDVNVVLADRQRLRQILLNLLSNAIKYNRLGGSVTISCKQKRYSVCLIVSDTGPGIAPDQVEMAFAPFERLGAEASQIEGTGVGLALSRHLAEVMGGTLQLESTSAGSHFIVELPVAERSLVAMNDEIIEPGEPSSSASNGFSSRLDRPFKVLYIEDNLSNIRLVERSFERLGDIKLLVANQGRLGVEVALANIPDLVLLDLHLPDLTGEEVLARLRADPRTCDIPVAVLSADATAGHIRRLRVAGATEYLTKPLEIAQLFAIVEKIATSTERSTDAG